MSPNLKTYTSDNSNDSSRHKEYAEILIAWIQQPFVMSK